MPLNGKNIPMHRAWCIVLPFPEMDLKARRGPTSRTSSVKIQSRFGRLLERIKDGYSFLGTR